MKKLLTGLVILVVLLVGALFVLPPMLANSVVKPKIVEAVEGATGREVTIGSLSLSVLPSIQVGMEDFVIANAEGMATPEMVVLGSLDLQLQAFPLIGKSVLVDALVVKDLAVFLEKDDQGRANWVFEAAGGGSDSASGSGGEGGAGAPLSDLQLGDVRIEGARLSYIDLASGQVIEGNDLELRAALAGLTEKLTLDGGLTLNDKPISLKAEVASPGALMAGETASVDAVVETEHLSLESSLSLAQRPQLAVDGSTGLQIGSVGALLAWLGQPLPENQPDPGSVDFKATFKTEGSKVTLEQATLAGEALDLTASGSVETAADKTIVSLQVDSGELDIDRYLPPPSAGGSAPGGDDGAAGSSRAGAGNPLDALPDDPIDLSALRTLEADLRISLGGSRPRATKWVKSDS